MQAFNKNKKRLSQRIPPLVLCLWSPFGGNTARLSLGFARELAQFTKVLLAELPCLGIPRLGLLVGQKEKEKNIDTMILEYEKRRRIILDIACSESESLSFLTGNVYGIPDHPLSNRVELETLMEFPGVLVKEAREKGFETIVYELQGQLATPLTFFALKQADMILIPLNGPEETAFALINIKRMLEVFYYNPDNFLILTSGEVEVLREAMAINTKNFPVKLKVLEASPRVITSYLAGENPSKKPYRLPDVWPFKRKNSERVSDIVSCKKGVYRGDNVQADMKIHL